MNNENKNGMISTIERLTLQAKGLLLSVEENIDFHRIRLDNGETKLARLADTVKELKDNLTFDESHIHELAGQAAIEATDHDEVSKRVAKRLQEEPHFFANIAKMIDCDVDAVADCIDREEVAEAMELDLSGLADNIDLSDLADHFTASDIANEFNMNDVAECVAEHMDTHTIAQEIDDHSIASCLDIEEVAMHIPASEIAYEMDSGEVAKAIIEDHADDVGNAMTDGIFRAIAERNDLRKQVRSLTEELGSVRRESSSLAGTIAALNEEIETMRVEICSGLPVRVVDGEGQTVRVIDGAGPDDSPPTPEVSNG